MVRAEAPSPAIAKRSSIFGLKLPLAAGISGHARLLTRPAYERLVAAEPLLRRLIPILIAIFLVIVGLTRVVELYGLKVEREIDAKSSLNLIATVIAVSLDKPGGATAATQNALAAALPPGATSQGRRVYLADDKGKIIAAAPDPTEVGQDLGAIVADAQPLMVFGQRAGVMELPLPDGSTAYAAARLLEARGGFVALVQPTNAVFSDWRADVSLNASIFIGTSAILLVILYGYFAQSTRANEADRIYSATQSRFETALTRGRSGLWDWDLARARVFWSRSMFSIVGQDPKDELLAFGDVRRLVHAEDGDLMTMVEALYASGEATFDKTFRVRHTGGHWVWLRVRAELVDRDTRFPHLIGIAGDVTEEMQLVERSRMADIRLRDAIETISEAFVLWDADNRLVMCNSKYQELHGLPDASVVPGTPYAELIAAGKKPLVRSRVVTEGRPEDGARTFELQLDDGRWLHINERRTKDGGFVSVGTDITPLKRHEGRLVDGERRLMATIADLRASRQKLELQAQQMVELAEKYAEEKRRAEEANRTKSEFLANISHELRTPLNAVIGFSEIMQSGMFGKLGSPKYDEYARDIHHSGTYLLGVINDILDMSRIEAGRMSLDVEDLTLDDLVDESIRIVSAQAAAQEIKVVSEAGKDLKLRGDRRALKQIMLNLLSNAVKFTPHGGLIRVRAKSACGSIIFTVGDTGIGIPHDALKKLGRPFEQVSNQFTKSHRGSGLGLAITASLANLHGGTMRIRSKEGQGTVVSVHLPVCGPAVEPERAVA